MSTEINFHSNNCEKNINQDKQNEISERMTVEKSESTSKCSEHINKCVELKEDKNAPEDKEENQSQVTYEMLTKKYISRKRKRGKKKKVQKGKKVDIEDQYYDQLIENFLSSENCDSIKDDIEVDPMTVLDIVQKLSVLIENKSDLKRPRKNKITKSLEDRKKDALETIKTKITIEQFCDLALNVLKIPKMGDSVNITKDDLKAKNITKVERKLKEYEEQNKGKVIKPIVSLTQNKEPEKKTIEDMINHDSDLSESLDESEDDSDEL